MNKLFDATDSILLIDEIETGLHKKYYDKLFPVVFELAKKLNVQLFIATHSMEAIDAILEYGKYENDTNSKDPIKVITLKKIDSNDGKGSNIAARKLRVSMCMKTARHLNLRCAYDDGIKSN